MPSRVRRPSASLATSTACDLRLRVRIPDRPTPVGRSFFGPCSHLDFVIFVTVSLAIPRRIPSNIFFVGGFNSLGGLAGSLAAVLALVGFDAPEDRGRFARAGRFLLTRSNGRRNLSRADA